MTTMAIRIAAMTVVFAKRHMQQIREVWRGSPLARAHTRICVYTYLAGFRVITDPYCVTPGQINQDPPIRGAK